MAEESGAALPEMWEEYGSLSRSRRLGIGQPGHIGLGPGSGRGGDQGGGLG